LGESLLSHNESIIDKLDKAADAVVSAGSPRTPLQPPTWVETDEGAAFLREIREADTLQLFDGTLQTIGSSATAVDRDQLANWMVERARIVRARQAVEEVDQYIRCDSFEAYQVMLLSGLPVDAEWDLGGEIQLVPPCAVPNQHLQAAWGRSLWNGLPTPELSSALIRPFHQQRVHLSQAQAYTGEGRPPHPQEWRVAQQALEDARLCLALVRTYGCGVQAIGSTAVAADDVPILNGFAWSIHSYRTPQSEGALISFEARTARSLHEGFLLLGSADQEHLRIPMQKLNECAANLDRVQAAIDLRIALESLFLYDKVQGEQTYRLALRAAISAGGNIEHRKETRTKTRKAYSLCSAAVHTGRVSSKLTDGEVLKWARNLVRETLCRMIHDGNGRPDWDAVELTGRTDCDEESS